MDDLALGEADGLEHAVAAVDQMIVERSEHQPRVAADGAEPVFVKGQNVVRAGTFEFPELFDPCVRIQYGNHGKPL